MDENCYVEPVQKSPATANQLQTAERATLAVSGMGCQNCATRVKNSLLSLEGVYGVDVYLNMALVEVIYNRNTVLSGALTDAVARAGNDGRHEYRADLITAQ
jgi:copper chaperone CopZ